MKYLKMKWFTLLIPLAVLWGCSPSAHIEKDDNTNFEKFKTYAWVEPRNDSSLKLNDLVERRVKEAVNEELQRTAGWRETNSNPDVLLSYDVLIERGLREEREPVYSRPFVRTFYNPYRRRFFNVYYPSQFVGYDNYDRAVKEGTVTVTMIDADTEKTVWQGWTTGELSSGKPSSKEIQSSIRAIFRKFDVARR